MSTPTEQAMLVSRAAAAVAITPASVAKELDAARDKLSRGLKKLAELSEDDLAIATVPREEVWREDMIRLYRCNSVVDKSHDVPVLITYALVGRFQMIDLEEERSLVRKLLASGFDVYFIDWLLYTAALVLWLCERGRTRTGPRAVRGRVT